MITLFGVNYLKYRVDYKVGIRKQDNLIDRINNIETILKGVTSKTDLENDLYAQISKQAFSIIESNTDLDTGFINILNLTQRKIISFAVRYLESPYRNNKNIVNDYIDIEASTIRNDIRHFANDVFTEKKSKLDFSTYIKKNTNIETIINVMIQRLKENGLDNDAYITLFKGFVKNLFIEYIKGYRKWVRLQV